MYSTLRTIERIVDRVIDIIFVLVLVVGIYYVYDSIFVFNRSDSSRVSAYKPDENNPYAFLELSDECVAWITIYDSGVDYPIMQADDNTKYLNTDPYGAYSLAGSIFLDSRCAKDFTDQYSLIYGHHMADGYMFGALDDFKDETFFQEHRDGEIVIDGKYYNIEVFAVSDTDASEGFIFNPEIEGDRGQWIEENNLIYEPPKGSRIVALSTCKSPTSTLRTIVFVSILE